MGCLHWPRRGRAGVGVQGGRKIPLVTVGRFEFNLTVAGGHAMDVAQKVTEKCFLDRIDLDLFEYLPSVCAVLLTNIYKVRQ